MSAHACNNPLVCPECVKRFWKWAEGWTRGRPPKVGDDAPSFYVSAAKFIECDSRSRGRG